MKQLILFLLVHTVIFSQERKNSSILPKKDTISISMDTIMKPLEQAFFSDENLVTIDSLLVQGKLYSSLIDTLDYVLNDKDINSIVTPVITSEELKLRLSSLNEKTPFNLAYNIALEKMIHRYLLQRKKYYPALMAKANYYFPMFERYLDQYNIPLEMKYLAIVESALRPKIKSRVGATGLWQFMYGTGKQFDLKVSSYVDERQDPVKATIAACKYLKQLFTIFGDWDLALAAYNSGPGNVRKAIKRSGGSKNYWNIRPYLPRETAGYVPAFYATMYIFEYAEEHEVYAELPVFFNFQTDTIRLKKTLSFRQISDKIDVNEQVISRLNPSYKLGIIPFIKGRNYAVRLPSNKIIEFLDKEKEIYDLAALEDAKREKPLPRYFEMDKRIRYKVRKGDFLGKIANKFGVRISDIKRWNRLKSSRLSIGQRLYIYPKKVSFSSIDRPQNKRHESTLTAICERDMMQQGALNGEIYQKITDVSDPKFIKWNDLWGDREVSFETTLKISKS